MFFFENSFPFFIYSVKIEWVYFIIMKEGHNNGIE